MLTIIIAIAAVVAGFGAAFIIYKPRLKVAGERLIDAQSAIERQREDFGKALANLEMTFKGLSSDILKESRDEFIKQAEPKIAEHVRPLQDALKRYDEALRSIEGKREAAYGGLNKQVDLLMNYTRELRDETGNLKNALKSTTVRGRWGEVTLRRVVELSGMSAHCDFDEQTSVTVEDGRLRPDMIVKIPGGRTVVVDAKTPLDAYLRAAEATSEDARSARLSEHAKAMREHMKKLSLKSYWEQFDSSTDMVVMFVPGESFAAAALEADRALLEDGMRSRVILATPATLIALLRSFAMGWQHEQLAENAQRISDAGKELFDRITTFANHFGKVGRNLKQATESFNDAVGSMERMLIPGARKLKELGATKSPDAALPEIRQIDAIAAKISSVQVEVETEKLL